MKYSRIPIHLLETSNEWTLGVEKYVRNVVGDVMNFQNEVAMNALSMLWSDMDTIV